MAQKKVTRKARVKAAQDYERGFRDGLQAAYNTRLQAELLGYMNEQGAQALATIITKWFRWRGYPKELRRHL